MPELPEVERFRQILLPLVHTKGETPSRKTKTGSKRTKALAEGAIRLELVGPHDKLPRKWVSPGDVDAVNANGTWRCRAVVRKGKQLCMVLEDASGSTRHFFLHMGMTGRLVSESMRCTWGQKYVSETHDIGTDWPPRFTYLVLTKDDGFRVAFADPRKFGGCHLADPDGTGTDNLYNISSSAFDDLAPDGWLETETPEQRREMASGLANQRLGIKALILDQKRVVSGVGNWVADEVLYQCQIHPDQSYLTEPQALHVVTTLHQILKVAVECLEQDQPYPTTWLFGYRWTKKQAGKDHLGRPLKFLTSGGRTSAIVASIQKLKKSQGKTPKAKRGDSTSAKAENPSTKSKPNSKKRAVVTPEKVPSSQTTPPVRKRRKTSNTKDVKPKAVKLEDGRRRSTRVRKSCVRYVA